jgi:hypothetical protein
MFQVLKRPSHAEMQPQPKLVTGPHKQMFAVALTFLEPAPSQSPPQFTRGNTFQYIRVVHFDVADSLVQ